MRTKTITLYKFDELSEKAKEKARDNIRLDGYDLYNWHDDNVQSLKAFAEFVSGKADWEVSLASYSSASVKIDGYITLWVEGDGYESFEMSELSGENLYNWLSGDVDKITECCPFTGYCMDEDLLDPMREYLGKSNPDDPRTLQDLVDEGVAAWLKAYIADWEYQYTDEAIDEFLENNDYEFTENGDRR